MAATAEEIEEAIRTAVTPGFRERLLERGQARSMIWRDGVLPDDAPPFSPLLTYDLLSYGYSLLSLSIRLLEAGGSPDVSRLGFESAADAIEAVVAKGDHDESRDFNRLVAAAAYHLGRFSARAYSTLQSGFAETNLSPAERALGLLMLRDLDALNALATSWRLDGAGSDDRVLTLLQKQLAGLEERRFLDGIDGSGDLLNVLDLALTDNFMAGIAIALLAMERGEAELIETAVARLQIGLGGSAELNLVPQWWCHRLTIFLLRDLWNSSFHANLPQSLAPAGSPQWKDLRELFIASLLRRSRAEIELWPSQLDAASQAFRINENLVVSLPTSAGKTRIAEFCILACLAADKRIVYVTPLRALSAQTEVGLQRTFQPLGKTVSSLYGSIGTSDVDENLLKDRHIVVATPEKLDFALRNDPSLIDDVGLIVLDEGHMIGLGEREVRYEVQIQRLLKRPDAAARRIVCLSAILPAGDQLSDFVAWLSRDQGEGLIQKDWRPTGLRYGEVNWRGDHARLNIQVGDQQPYVSKFFVSRVPPKKQRKTPFPRDQRELCLATAWRLVEDGHSVLIYCPLRASVEPFAKAVVDLHDRGLLPSVLEKDGAVLATALAIGAEWFGNEHPVLQCLRLGVAIHHGVLPTPFRREVERLLRERVLKITVSSPTLAQGLNLSATTLIVYSVMRHGERISSSEFRNVAGRAGRAYVDLEGLVLHPMFDDHANRRQKWHELIADHGGHELESGLLRLVITLLIRMSEKIGTKDTDKLTEYVMNNAAAWSFTALATETPAQADMERSRWGEFLTSLDTAILSLIGEQEVAEGDVEAKLDEILASSLWARRLSRQSVPTQQVIKAGLTARARFIWKNSASVQRRGYFLAGVGLDTGRELDARGAELTPLLVQANGAILVNDKNAAIEAVTNFAEIIFSIPPFSPDDLPENWKAILAAWLEGKLIAEFAAGHEDEMLQFIEQALIYRLPWGMEAVRVRAVANGDTVGDGLTVDAYELGLAVAAVETGTLDRSAATLIRAGFSSRTAAIKAISDTNVQFTTAHGLRQWLNSALLAERNADPSWPTPETAELWRTFRNSFVPVSQKMWRHRTYNVNVNWANLVPAPAAGTPVRLLTKSDDGATLVLTSDCELVGSLANPLSPNRSGLVIAALNTGQKTLKLEYLGPDDLFLT